MIIMSNYKLKRDNTSMISFNDSSQGIIQLLIVLRNLIYQFYDNQVQGDFIKVVDHIE